MLLAYNFNKTIKIKPTPSAVGYCPGCGEQLIPCCGKVMIHHWKHKQKSECSFSNNEGEWHESIKMLYHDYYNAEVEFFLPDRAHIADVFIPYSKTVIEIQHSPISLADILSRNRYWMSGGIQSVKWIVDSSHKKAYPNKLTYQSRCHDFFDKWDDAIRLGNGKVDVCLFSGDMNNIIVAKSLNNYNEPNGEFRGHKTTIQETQVIPKHLFTDSKDFFDWSVGADINTLR